MNTRATAKAYSAIGPSRTADLLANTRRLLLDARGELFTLARQIDKGERLGRDKETVALLLDIDMKIGYATGLLFDCTTGGERPPVQ